MNLDNVNVVSNGDLRGVLEATAAPEQGTAAVTLSEEQHLRTWKLGFLILEGISAVAGLPASRLLR